MDVYVDSNGNRVFINQPWIDRSYENYNLVYTNPNGPPFNCGLYEQNQPSLIGWQDLTRQYRIAGGTPKADVLPNGILVNTDVKSLPRGETPLATYFSSQVGDSTNPVFL